MELALFIMTATFILVALILGTIGAFKLNSKLTSLHLEVNGLQESTKSVLGKAVHGFDVQVDEFKTKNAQVDELIASLELKFKEHGALVDTQKVIIENQKTLEKHMTMRKFGGQHGQVGTNP